MILTQLNGNLSLFNEKDTLRTKFDIEKLNLTLDSFSDSKNKMNFDTKYFVTQNICMSLLFTIWKLNNKTE